jgi:hypothetical protein
MILTFTVTDRFGQPDLSVTVAAEDTAAGVREARWVAAAMAVAMGSDPDHVLLDSVNL